MKLYSIWWEEEIPLMYSCNDCSKTGEKKKKREMPAFTSFESLERNQSFESEWGLFFLLYFSSLSPTPGHSSDSSELTQIASRVVERWPWKCQAGFDTPGPAVSRPLFDSRGMFVVLPKRRLRCEEEWRLDVWRKRSAPRWNTEEETLRAPLVSCFSAQHVSQGWVFGERWQRLGTESFSVTAFDKGETSCHVCSKVQHVTEGSRKHLKKHLNTHNKSILVTTSSFVHGFWNAAKKNMRI